jgi:hypothetical protein
MTRGITYSKPLAGAAVAALVVAGALFCMREANAANRAGLRRHAESDERALEAQVSAMSAFEDENVAALRARVGRLRLQLGPDGTWERLVSRLGAGWGSEAGTREDKAGYSIQTGTVSVLSRGVDEWPAIVEAVGQMEAMPGVGIAEFEMKTSGSGDRRTLDTARMLVVIQTTRTGSTAISP